jgi:hypothetical protein
VPKPDEPVGFAEPPTASAVGVGYAGAAVGVVYAGAAGGEPAARPTEIVLVEPAAVMVEVTKTTCGTVMVVSIVA